MDDTPAIAPQPFSAEVTERKMLSKKFLLVIGIFLLACMAGGALLIFFCAPPADFPASSHLSVVSGESLSAITENAQSLHLVRSATLLKTLIELVGRDRHLSFGDYYFPKPISALAIAGHLATGNFNIKSVRVTLIEGMTRAEMVPILAANLPNFSSSDFMSETADQEGFLFPDTYFISPFATTDDVITLLHGTYEEKIAPLQSAIAASGMTEHDVITLASIVEKEAAGDADRSIIAGILLERLKNNIPLEVDAPFLYITQFAKVTPADLTIDSPYNTYTHKGLPPGPIGNPGLKSILAVLHPTMTKYLFYLHDKNGDVHFAETFAEHERNIQLYLN